MESSQIIVSERLQQAENAHGLEAFLACFAPHIQSDHPVHPKRAFRGVGHVRQNWSAMVHDILDFHSESLRQLRVARPGLSDTGSAPVVMAHRLGCAE